MDDSFFKIEIAPNHFICMSPLAQEVLDALGVDDLGDDFGYFIYESTGRSITGCINVLAKCPSFEAAARLLEIYTLPTHEHNAA